MQNSEEMDRLVIIALVMASMFLCRPSHAAANCDSEMGRIRRTNDWRRIRNTANRLLERNPQSQYCLMSLVEADIQLKLYDEARANLVRLRSKFGNQQPYLWMLLEHLAGNYREADKYVVEMLASDPRNPVILDLSEKNTYKIDRNRWIQLVIKNRNLDHASWYLTGGTSGDHTKASGELTQLLKKHQFSTLYEFIDALLSPVPKNKLTVDERLMVANANLGLNHEEASLEWSETIALAKPREVLEILDGMASRGYKNHSKAGRILEQMEAVSKNDWLYWYVRSNQAFQQNCKEQALLYCVRGIELNSNERNLWQRFTLHRIAAATKFNRDAHSQLLEDLKPLIQKYPSLRAYKERAKIFHEKRLYEEELRDLDRLIEMEPAGEDKLKTRMQKAEIEYTLGDLRAAKRTVESILQVQPDNSRCTWLKESIRKEMKRASIRE